MLKEILSVSGKPGLFKLVSQGKNMFVAESLIDQKRIPVYARDKVVSLGDIAIYTEDDEVPLYQVLSSIQAKENGAPIVINSSIQPEELKAYFETILPDFDKDRVYPSDIKKIMNWYNLLIKFGFTEFKKKEDDHTPEDQNDGIEKKEEINK